MSKEGRHAGRKIGKEKEKGGHGEKRKKRTRECAAKRERKR
jgi:hypothetical protein